jgi:hypothetical protein
MTERLVAISSSQAASVQGETKARPLHSHHPRARPRITVEKARQLFRDGAGQLFGIGDRDRAFVVARHVMADADGQKLHRLALLDHGDHVAQVLLEVIRRVHRERGVVHRRAVGDHHQDLARLGPVQHPPMRPFQRLAVDVLLQSPSFIISPRLSRTRRQGASAGL